MHLEMLTVLSSVQATDDRRSFVAWRRDDKRVDSAVPNGST